jgi:hypothetical protein
LATYSKIGRVFFNLLVTLLTCNNEANVEKFAVVKGTSLLCQSVKDGPKKVWQHRTQLYERSDPKNETILTSTMEQVNWVQSLIF